MQAICGRPEDIEAWMALVQDVAWNFPGLETSEAIEEHRRTVLKFMAQDRALCVKAGAEITGVLLFSRKRNRICCLAVSERWRRRGIASMLLTEALRRLDRTREVSVSTFRQEDPKGVAPRALYARFGFEPDALIEEFGYPNQRFVLRAQAPEKAN